MGALEIGASSLGGLAVLYFGARRRRAARSAVFEPSTGTRIRTMP